MSDDKPTPAPYNYPVIIRGFKRVGTRRAMIFQERKVLQNAEDVEQLAIEHMQILGESAHMIEFEFPTEPPEDRFFRFGTDPSLMTLPLLDAVTMPKEGNKPQ